MNPQCASVSWHLRLWTRCKASASIVVRIPFRRAVRLDPRGWGGVDSASVSCGVVAEGLYEYIHVTKGHTVVGVVFDRIRAAAKGVGSVSSPF